MAARFAAAIEQIFKVTPGDAAALARDLQGRYHRAYERTVNSQLEAHGHPGTFRLTNGDELRRLRAQAIETAQGIAATYNADLAQKVDAVVAAEGTRGLNRRTLARRLSDWDRERSAWKTPQIAQTESRRIATQATATFVRNSRLDDVARFVILPAASSDDDANDIAARNGTLLTLAEVEALGLPAHPHEQHSAAMALPVSADLGAAWLGA